MQLRTLIAFITIVTMRAQTPVAPSESVPLHRITVVQSSAKAINYQYLKSSTRIDFKGTALAPAASGTAKRAEAARDYLVSQGVTTDNIVARGLGKANRIDTNDTASGRQNNRRVELVVLGTGITDAPAAVN